MSSGGTPFYDIVITEPKMRKKGGFHLTPGILENIKWSISTHSTLKNKPSPTSRREAVVVTAAEPADLSGCTETTQAALTGPPLPGEGAAAPSPNVNDTAEAEGLSEKSGVNDRGPTHSGGAMCGLAGMRKVSSSIPDSSWRECRGVPEQDASLLPRSGI